MEELVSTIHIIVIGIVADDDTRVLHHVLDEADAREIGIGESLIGVWSILYCHNCFDVKVQPLSPWYII